MICEGDPAQRDRVIQADPQRTCANTTLHVAASDKGKRWVGVSTSEVAEGSVQGAQIEGQLLQPSSSHALQSAPSTLGTPAYQLAPRRVARPAAVLRSPYINYEAKLNFRPSRFANVVYDAVCKATRRTTWSSQSPTEDVIIINYEDYYVNLSHLSLSMKPGGKLYNIAAEIGIYTLMDFKVKYPRKRIMAVSVSTFIQSGQISNNEVQFAFDREENHLDRSHMIFSLS